MKRFPVLVIALICISLSAYAQGKRYIRAGVVGGDGTSWATAYGTFGQIYPWSRDYTYYIAGGSYQEDFFNVNCASTDGARRLVIKKANEADNGSDPGWNPAYATTQAVLDGIVSLNGSYITFDGVTGSGRSGYGIKVVRKVGANGNAAFYFDDGTSFNELAHTEFEGPGIGYANGVSPFKHNSSSQVKGDWVHHNWFHDFNQNAAAAFINLVGTSWSDYGVLFENNIAENVWDNLNLAHGQGIQIGSGTSPSTQAYHIYRNNTFHNVQGTAQVALLGWGTNSDIDIYNNVFSADDVSYDVSTHTWVPYGTEDYAIVSPASSPGCIYTSPDHQKCTNLRVVNNTFYRQNRASIWSQGAEDSGIINKNNLFAECRFTTVHYNNVGQNNCYWACEAMISSGDQGVPYGEVGQITETQSPFVSIAGRNFRLRTGANCIGAGQVLSSIFTTDYDGATRTTWDIGAFVSSGEAPSAPPSQASGRWWILH